MKKLCRKKREIIMHTLPVLTAFTFMSCAGTAAGNEKSDNMITMQDETQNEPEDYYTDEDEILQESYEPEVTEAEPWEWDESDPEISEYFYGYKNPKPCTLKGTGPVKPESYAPADYFFYSFNPEIKDPELKKLIDDFTEKSKNEILADLRKYCEFNQKDAELNYNKEIQRHITVINNYCFVMIFVPEQYVYGNRLFEARCGYFDIKEKKQVSVSDLFFRDSNFTDIINRKIKKSENDEKLKRGFEGLSEEYILLYPQKYDYELKTDLLSFHLICPDINPYGMYDTMLDYYDIALETVVLAEPVYQPETVIDSSMIIWDSSSHSVIKYGQGDGELLHICPLSSELFSDEEIKNVTQSIEKCYEEEFASMIERYKNDYGEEWKRKMGFLVNIRYDSDADVFRTYLDTDGGVLSWNYYRRGTGEKLSADEVSEIYIGTDWEEYIIEDDRECPDLSSEDVRRNAWTSTIITYYWYNSADDRIYSRRRVPYCVREGSVESLAYFVLNENNEWTRISKETEIEFDEENAYRIWQ